MNFLGTIQKRLLYLVKKLTYTGNFLFSQKKGVSSDKKDPQLIVSLTSYPARYPQLHLTLTSLLTQSVKPNMIILWLSEDQKPQAHLLRKWARLVGRGITIRYVPENIRSYKKLIYALKEFPKATIITVDDENMYPKDLVETLYTKHKEYPKSIVGTRCTYITKISKNEVSPYIEWKESTELNPSFNNFVTGVGGVLYPPNSLHKEVLNFDAFLKLAPHADDIWFKAMGVMQGTKTVPVIMGPNKLVFSKASQTGALWHTNVTQDKNSEQFKNVFSEYDLYRFMV